MSAQHVSLFAASEVYDVSGLRRTDHTALTVSLLCKCDANISRWNCSSFSDCADASRGEVCPTETFSRQREQPLYRSPELPFRVSCRRSQGRGPPCSTMGKS